MLYTPLWCYSKVKLWDRFSFQATIRIKEQIEMSAWSPLISMILLLRTVITRPWSRRSRGLCVTGMTLTFRLSVSPCQSDDSHCRSHGDSSADSSYLLSGVRADIASQPYLDYHYVEWPLRRRCYRKVCLSEIRTKEGVKNSLFYSLRSDLEHQNCF